MLREKGIKADSINYFEQAFTASKLRQLIKKIGLTPGQLLRKNDPAYKEYFGARELADDNIIELMLKHPSLLQRPIVEVGESAVLARPIEKVYELLKIR